MSHTKNIVAGFVTAFVPTFIILNLNGTTAFHGFDSSVLLALYAGSMAAGVQAVRAVSAKPAFKPGKLAR